MKTIMKTSSLRSVSCLGILVSCGFLFAGESRPGFEQLFRMNASNIFGGNVKLEKVLKDDVRLTIHYNKPGQIKTGFLVQGLIDPDSLKKSNRKILENPEGGGEIKNLVVAGEGKLQSRFELKGDLAIHFDLRIQMIQRGSQLAFALVQKKPRAMIQSSFFQAALFKAGSRTVARAMAPVEYQKPPALWFDCKALVPVSISLKDDSFQVKLSMVKNKGARGKRGGKKKEKDKEKKEAVELINLEGVKDFPGGLILISASRAPLVISDLKITGNVDRAWCEKEFDRLEKTGALVLEAKKEGKPPEKQQRLRKKRILEGKENEREAEIEL